VDLELSTDEQELVGAIRRLCAERFSMEQVRAGEGRRLLDRQGWSALAETGVFSLRTGGDGGAGLGLAAAALVFEELGRALVPGPLVGTEVAAGVVKGAATGEVPVALVRRPLAGCAVPVVVGDFDALGALVVVGEDGAELLAPESLDAEPVGEGLDPLTPLWRLGRLPAGEALGDAATAARLWRDHQVLCAALLVGMAAATCDMAVHHAKGRVQFGVPIGSFQAVKHLCADMLVRAETARAALHVAALTADQPEVGDDRRAAAGAALVAGRAALDNAKASLQVHGGMGFTWEVPVHLYLKRAVVVTRSLEPPGTLAGVVAERF
jgi:alkylation response protein AidB-like acyl-CoA dehydrogenase